jgi:hypothetical protein
LYIFLDYYYSIYGGKIFGSSYHLHRILSIIFKKICLVDSIGVDSIGVDSIGVDSIGVDSIEVDGVGVDWIGVDWIGVDWIGVDWIGFKFDPYVGLRFILFF